MRTRLTVAAVVALLALTIPAQAKTLTGTPGDDRLIGTARADTIDGGTGADVIRGRGGDDGLIAHADGSTDRVYGGPGWDQCTGGSEDSFQGCEIIRVLLD